jgi:hypothetical protein
VQAKQPSKRKRRKTALPVLPVVGAAGVSLAMAGGASATMPAANIVGQDAGPQVILGEEEISDVSLATFYVFDKENESDLGGNLILARGGCGGGCGCHGGGGGCRAGVGCGCGHGCGCRGCGRGCGCGCGGLWIGGCVGCGGGCGSCWQWSPFFGRWILVC